MIGGMGEKKLHKVMTDIIQTAERTELMPHVRDGYIMTYIYLPTVFGNTFVQYVGPILPSILQVCQGSRFVSKSVCKFQLLTSAPYMLIGIRDHNQGIKPTVTISLIVIIIIFASLF